MPNSAQSLDANPSYIEIDKYDCRRIAECLQIIYSDGSFNCDGIPTTRYELGVNVAMFFEAAIDDTTHNDCVDLYLISVLIQEYIYKRKLNSIAEKNLFYYVEDFLVDIFSQINVIENGGEFAP